MIRVWTPNVVGKCMGKAFSILQSAQKKFLEEQKLEPSSDTSEKKQNEAGEGANGLEPKASINIGDIVVTSSGKNKSAWDKQEATVTKVLSKKITVEFLTGPERGARKEFQRDKVFLKKNVDEKDEKVAKHPLADPDESGPVLKAQRAQNLFGAGADADLV